MIEDCILFSVLFILNINMFVKTQGVPVFNLLLMGRGPVTPYPVVTSFESSLGHLCFLNNKWEDCPFYMPGLYPGTSSLVPNTPTVFRGLPYITKPPGALNMRPLHGRWPINGHSTQSFDYFNSYNPYSMSGLGVNQPSTRRSFNLKMENADKNILGNENVASTSVATMVNTYFNSNSMNRSESTTTAAWPVGSHDNKTEYSGISLIDEFLQRLGSFERTFYMTTFNKLVCISPEDRRENGMSFVQSGLFLQMTLMALSTEVDANTRAEIERSIGFHHTQTDKINIIRQIMTSLPNSTDDLKFRRSSRLVLRPGCAVSALFCAEAADALRLRIHTLNGTETPEVIATTLNNMVENDSGGAIRDTFEESEVTEGVDAVLVTTLYLRARWRSAPTLLNGTRPFRDAGDAPERTVRMIRINDVMGYASLNEWDAEAMEISYSTPGLSLLMLVPRGRSLRSLSARVANATSLASITDSMRPVRVAATLPLYTLRMTLLLPNKLQAMGISRLLDSKDTARNRTLRLSHAVQRLMFWAEAGRNAFKDDGIEWDEPPELAVVVDRPYIFFVRWKNITLMNGHFVL